MATFGGGTLQANVSYDGVNERSLGEFNAPSFQALDVDAYVISGVSLVFNVKSQLLKVRDYLQDLLICVPNEDSIVHVHNEDGVVAVEDAIINFRLGESDLQQFGFQMMIPHSASLFLSVNVAE